MENATFEDFQKIDLRVGTITKVEPFPEARKPAYKLTIDFGALGIKQSSAQITKRYTAEELVGQQIVAVFNFPPKKVAGFKSEVLVLGATPEADDVVLLSPENKLPNGSVVR
jgi:tRNA-binding protein